MFRKLLLAAVLFVWIATAAACDNAPRVWVVAVGVNKYIRPLNALPKAAEGAQKVAEALAGARPQSTDITLLTPDSDDESLQPTKANVVRTLTQLAQNVKPNDLVIFYFGGHGIEQDGQQFLLTKEADLSSPDGIIASTISLSWLRKKMESLPCSGRLLLLDACRETLESLKVTGGVGQPAPITRDFLLSGGGWQTQPGKASVTFFGCGEGEKVYHGKNGSFFTEALVEGIAGKAKDADGQVTLKSLADYVRGRVPQDVHREFGESAKQEPVLKGVGKGIVLRPSPGYVACFKFDGEYGDLFAETVQTRLAASGELHLVERSALASVMKELKLQDMGITDPSTAKKLGKLVNAKYVVAGSSKKGPDGRLHVTARMVAVETGRDVPGVAAECDVEPSDWKPGVAQMADDLLGRMNGSVLPREVASGNAPLKTKQAKIPASAVQWRIEDGGNGHYYLVVGMSGLIKWPEAKAAAERAGGYLATITSAAENDFVFSLAEKNDKAWARYKESNIGPWLGGRRPPEEPEADKGWTWVTGEPFTYTNWAPDQPNNTLGIENCLHYLGLGDGKSNQWNDLYELSETHGYVMECNPSPTSGAEPPKSAKIPTDAVQWRAEDGGNGHYYEAITVDGRGPGITWQGASGMADALGGYLVTITSKAENEFVTALIWKDNKTNRYFLGGSRMAPGSPDWQWVTGEPFAYASWAPGCPDGGATNQDRLNYDRDYGWDDIQSTQPLWGYLVEWGPSAAVNSEPLKGVNIPTDAIQWRIQDGGNGHYYQAVPTPGRITWKDAQEIAASKGGYLATVTSAAENQFVFSVAKEVDACWHDVPAYDFSLGPWLGGCREPGAADIKMGWRWDNGEPFKYTAWAMGQPSSDNGEDRIQYAGRGVVKAATWNDVAGESAMWGYVIEWGSPAGK